LQCATRPFHSEAAEAPWESMVKTRSSTCRRRRTPSTRKPPGQLETGSCLGRDARTWIEHPPVEVANRERISCVPSPVPVPSGSLRLETQTTRPADLG
ncbi:hypothetical protein THAOC_18308, partial [Thalassiosira oceanica]